MLRMLGMLSICLEGLMLASFMVDMDEAIRDWSRLRSVGWEILESRWRNVWRLDGDCNIIVG